MIKRDAGFVLPTALLLLTLLSMLATTMYYVSRASMVTSSASNASTTAVYYAETAIHYMSWAFAINDAEFDDFRITGSYVLSPLGDPPVPSTASAVGDKTELMSYLWNPGPTGNAGSSASDALQTAYTAGQVLYFDNSPMAKRHVCMERASVFSKCIDVTLQANDRWEPIMPQVSTSLPRYIKLDISAGDSSKTPAVLPSIVTSIPSLPHRSPPQTEHDQLAGGSYDHNGDIPKNGAVVWLTAGDPFNENHDLELFPLDPAGKYPNSVKKPIDCHLTLPYNKSEVNNRCPCLQSGGQVNSGSVASNNGIHWEVNKRSGNDIVIQYVTQGVNKPLVVSNGVLPSNYPNPNAVVLMISLATDSMGIPISKALDVIDAATTYLNNPNTPAQFSTLNATFLKKVLDYPVPKTNKTVSDGTGLVALNTRTLVHLNNAQGCNANTGEWLPTLPSYNIVAYAIAYVNGKPSHMLRAIIR